MFGGFTTMKWDKSDSYKTNDPCAFIYSINNKKKYKCTDQRYCILGHASYGPMIGGGRDIEISDNSS